ncbi:hypothetical protein PILCRDRAFT_813064 [Piloderma croceum F 1598]|uniref:F-box domain-containing protein n=1 Tax=Piloderma croceum (strain F 1598) TaxID=765440 RepID=A0A0C3FY85_PILCF|nr:hypothetical protein PILCRDRAFT_813064 [Piloderma croceum F 1598]
MHDCLLIAEMQTKILEYVIQSDRGHRTLAALARTCKALAEPCLDVLWHRQERGLGALMKTLPADLWEVSYGSLSFTRQFVWSDWTRFSYYARRIQELSVGINAFANGHGTEYLRHKTTTRSLDEISIDVRALDTMSPSGVPLLCNLRQLAFSDDPESMKVARFLLAPTIRTIHLDFVSDIFTDSDATTFLAILKNKCPFLGHLEFCGIPDELCPTVSQFICGWENLQTLWGNQSPIVTDETFIHLASLPTLSKLKLNLGYNSLPLALPSQSFAGLRDLDLCTYNIEVITDLLKSSHRHHLLPLRSLALRFHSPISVQPVELTHVIHDHCAHPCLTRLVLHDASHIPCSSFDSYMLRPLFAFTKLVIVDIFYDLHRIDDTLLGEMAKAWPQLERLTLGNNMEINGTNMTLAGLVPLARYCPKLEATWLPFDASNIERPGRKFRNRQLTKLGIGYSNIKDAMAVAEFLSDIFPNLCSISWPAQNRAAGEKWREVLKMLDMWRREGG